MVNLPIRRGQRDISFITETAIDIGPHPRTIASLSFAMLDLLDRSVNGKDCMTLGGKCVHELSIDSVRVDLCSCNVCRSPIQGLPHQTYLGCLGCRG